LPTIPNAGIADRCKPTFSNAKRDCAIASSQPPNVSPTGANLPLVMPTGVALMPAQNPTSTTDRCKPTFSNPNKRRANASSKPKMQNRPVHTYL